MRRNAGIILSTGVLLLTLSHLGFGWPLNFDADQFRPVNHNNVAEATYKRFDPKDRASWLCMGCKVIMELVQAFFALGKTVDEIESFARRVCIDLKIEDTRVCTLGVHEFGGEVLYIFEKVAVGPSEICGLILGEGCAEPYHFYSEWNVTFPKIKKPPVAPILPPKEGSPVSRVLQITDTHYDPTYTEGSNTHCGEPLCCRKNDGPAPKGILPAGKFGYYNCDTPTVTLDGLFKHVSSLKSKIDYIIWTGDVPAHNVWNQSRADQMNAIKQATRMFMQYFPGMKVYPALGNHESAPVNSFPPPFITGKQSNLWLLETLAEAWGHWLPEECQETIKKGGYYTTLIQKGFRIVSLNMNYCNNQNWWLMINSVDPAGQLQWLIGVLQKAEINKEKVHIIGHIPPGHGDCLKYWSRNYYEIIDRYQSTVTAQFFGHTHHDHYEIFLDKKEYKTPTNIAYIGPSVTPYTNLNPGYRIYEVDGDYANSSRVVLNHETYIIDLEKANKLGVANWEFEYNAKDAYKMPSLTPKDWNDLVLRMKDDDELFQVFYKNYYKQHVTEKCTGKCKISMLCSLREAKSKSEPELCSFDEAQTKAHRAHMFSLRKC